MQDRSLIIVVCIISAKTMGCINIYPNPVKFTRKWWVNYGYKLIIFIILLSANALQRPVQDQLFYASSKIVMGKIFAESTLYWITLYASFVTIVYYNQEIDTWIGACSALKIEQSQLGYIFKHHILLCGVFSILKLAYYGSASVQSEKMNLQAMASLGYFINRFTVSFINLLFTSALRILTKTTENLNSSLIKLAKQLKGPIYPTTQLVRDFRFFRERWHDIDHLSKKLNTIFSIHIWLFTTFNLLEIIYVCNQLISLHPHCGPNDKCFIWSSITVILWLLVYLLPDLNMFQACSELTYQSQQTAQFVTNFEMETNSKEVIRDVKNFSNELLLTKIEISAGGGCFVVNNDLIAARVGTFLTFLVILSEFERGGDHTYYNGFSR